MSVAEAQCSSRRGEQVAEAALIGQSIIDVVVEPRGLYRARGPAILEFEVGKEPTPERGEARPFLYLEGVRMHCCQNLQW